MRIQRILDKAWQWLSADRRSTETFVILAVIQCLIFFIPQAPVPQGDSPAYLSWIAELRPQLKGFTNPLASMGLFTVRTSLWMRGPLVLLAFLIVARAASLHEAWATLARAKRLRGLAFCTGGLLVIAGWGMQTLWGWKQPQVIAWPETEVAIPERGLTLPPQRRRWNLWAGQYGLYLLPKEDSIGVIAQALNKDGKVVPLLSSARSEPQQQLQLAFTNESPEAYFALSEADLVFRINQRPGEKSIEAQVYRTASGELVAETTLQADGTLFTGDIRLNLELDTLPHYEAVYNPGAWIEAAGMLALAVAVGWRTGRESRDESESPEAEAGNVQ